MWQQALGSWKQTKILCVFNIQSSSLWTNNDLKSLGPIDRKFHGHGENDGFVLYEYIINNSVVFANIQ